MANPKIKDGVVRWFDGDGLLHREEGPAFIKDGFNGYYRHGALHREDGPAYCSILERLYYFEGKYFPEVKNDHQWFAMLKLKCMWQ